METPGTLIDKLITVDLKMWNNQESLYEIRRMSYEEFCKRFCLPCEVPISRSPDAYGNSYELYNILKKACDLNVQRNALIFELDQTFEKLLNHASTGQQQQVGADPHKTY